MIKLLMWIGRIVGLVGFGAAATAVLLRTMGQWHLGDLQIGTLLQAGVAAMVPIIPAPFWIRARCSGHIARLRAERAGAHDEAGLSIGAAGAAGR